MHEASVLLTGQPSVPFTNATRGKKDLQVTVPRNFFSTYTPVIRDIGNAGNLPEETKKTIAKWFGFVDSDRGGDWEALEKHQKELPYHHTRSLLDEDGEWKTKDTSSAKPAPAVAKPPPAPPAETKKKPPPPAPPAETKESENIKSLRRKGVSEKNLQMLKDGEATFEEMLKMLKDKK